MDKYLIRSLLDSLCVGFKIEEVKVENDTDVEVTGVLNCRRITVILQDHGLADIPGHVVVSTTKTAIVDSDGVAHHPVETVNGPLECEEGE